MLFIFILKEAPGRRIRCFYFIQNITCSFRILCAFCLRRDGGEYHHREHKHESESIPQRERRAQERTANDGGRDGFTEAIEDGFIGTDEAHAGHVAWECHDVTDQDDADDAELDSLMSVLPWCQHLIFYFREL